MLEYEISRAAGHDYMNTSLYWILYCYNKSKSRKKAKLIQIEMN